MKGYKPRQTVFEINRTGTGANATAAEVMKRKRDLHAGTIQKNEQRCVCMSMFLAQLFLSLSPLFISLFLPLSLNGRVHGDDLKDLLKTNHLSPWR